MALPLDDNRLEQALDRISIGRGTQRDATVVREVVQEARTAKLHADELMGRVHDHLAAARTAEAWRRRWHQVLLRVLLSPWAAAAGALGVGWYLFRG